MDSQARRKHRHNLARVFRKVERFSSKFLSAEDLRGLGIRISAVDLNDAGILQFSPCFFKPQQKHILDLYPASNPSKIAKLSPPLSDHHDPDWDLITRAEDTAYHIECQARVRREGMVNGMSALLDLTTLCALWR